MIDSISSTRRLVVALIVLLVASAMGVSMVLPASPALAAAGDIKGGSGSKGSQGGGQSGGGLPRCDTSNGTGIDTDGTRNYFLAPFPGCIPNGNGFTSAPANWTPGLAVCPMGTQVWRFYGTPANPAQYTSVSNAYDPTVTECNEQPRVYRYLIPNPQDAGFLACGDLFGWCTGGYLNRMGQGVTLPGQGGCTPPNCLTTTDKPFRYLANGVDSGANCSNLQARPDPMETQVNGANGTFLRAELAALFAQFNNQYSSSAIALNSINAAGPVPAPGAQGVDINYNDQIPCSSTLDFSRASSANDPIVMGECVIPMVRPARVYKNDGYAFWNEYVSPKLGPRYTDDYRGEADAQRNDQADLFNNRFVNGRITVGRANNAWRDAIRNEVNSRGGYIPGVPSNEARPSANPNRGASANAAADNAFCFTVFPGVFDDAGVETKEGLAGSGVKVKVTAPDSFQVSNDDITTSTLNEVSTQAGVLMCGTRTCGGEPLDPSLVSVSYNLVIAPTTTAASSKASSMKYEECLNRYQAGCQFFLETAPRRVSVTYDSSGSSSGNASTKARVRFFSGTAPGRQMEVRLENVSATQQKYKQVTYSFTICSPIADSTGGNDCKTSSSTRIVRDGGPVAVGLFTSYNGAERAMPGIVATKPVIGAVGGTP